MPIGSLGVEDLFQLGADWEPQQVVQTHEIVNATAKSEYGVITLERGAQIGLRRYEQVYRCCATTPITLSVSLGSGIGSVLVTGMDLQRSAGDVATVTMFGLTIPDQELSLPAHTFDINANITPLEVETAITDPATGISAITQSGQYTITVSFGKNEYGISTIVNTSNPLLVYSEEGAGSIPLGTLPSLGIDLITCTGFDNSASNQEMDTYSATFSGPFVNPF